MRKLEEELKKLADSDMYPFHMPGHKRRGEEHAPCIDPVAAACAWDITEIDGFDNLHDPSGLLLGEMERAAAFYGTRETYFLVNGSTCGILAAISAAVPRGGRILMERGCHISVYHAAYLMQLETVYIEDLPCLTGDFDAVIITSPSYEGLVKDVRLYAEFAHAHGAVLIVDEAHGAHFSLHPYFPESAVRCGADLVAQSLHKTLPSLTSTALLHNVSGRVSSEKLRRFLNIYETSSPSYVLMASIASLLHALEEKGPGYFDDYVESLKELRAGLSSLKCLRLAGGSDCILTSDSELPGGKCGMRTDPGKIVILTPSRDLSAVRDGSARSDIGHNESPCSSAPVLYGILREKYHLQPEMKAPGYVLLMTSPADMEEGFRRLRDALLETDAANDLSGAVPESVFAERRSAGAAEKTDAGIASDGGNSGKPCPALRISEAMDAEAEAVPFADAPGRVAADFVIQYPPDVPVLVPGEVISENMIEKIRALKAAGFTITGCDKERFLCVK